VELLVLFLSHTNCKVMYSFWVTSLYV